MWSLFPQNKYYSASVGSSNAPHLKFKTQCIFQGCWNYGDQENVQIMLSKLFCNVTGGTNQVTWDYITLHIHCQKIMFLINEEWGMTTFFMLFIQYIYLLYRIWWYIYDQDYLQKVLGILTVLSYISILTFLQHC